MLIILTKLWEIILTKLVGLYTTSIYAIRIISEPKLCVSYLIILSNPSEMQMHAFLGGIP